MLKLLLLVSLAADPKPADLLKQGLLALRQGNIAEARADLERASRVHPKNAYVWSALAQTYLRANEPQLASAAAEKAERIGGRDPVVCHALAMYYSETGQLQHAAKLDAQVAFYWIKALLQRGDFTQAANVAEAGLAGHPNDPQMVLALGVARYGQRRFEDAIKMFLELIRIDPSIEQPYVFLGRMLEQAGPHLDEITNDYEAWVARDSQNAKAHLLLAKALLAGDPQDEKSETLLRRSIALDSSDWESHYELGVLLAGKHAYNEAASELKRSIELNAKEPIPHYHLARVYDRLGQPEKAKAERELHQRMTEHATSH